MNLTKDCLTIDINCFGYKEKSDYFDKYTTSYPFDLDKLEKIYKKFIYQKTLLLHERFMLWFENIFEVYINSTNAIFSMTNNITDISWKYYIAIMAVSTIQSEYMLYYLENEFLLSGGEVDWLVYGLSKAPEKLQQLGRVNNIIAHQPWKFNLKELCDCLNSWNQNELLEALLILVHFHRQATLIESLKVKLKEDTDMQDQIKDLLKTLEPNKQNNLFDCLNQLNLEEDKDEEDEDEEVQTDKDKINLMSKELSEVKEKEEQYKITDSADSRSKSYFI